MNPHDITADEVRRLRQSLRKRFVNRNYPQVIDVRLGKAARQSAGTMGPDRPWAVVFHVKKKLARPRAAEFLPKQVTVRLKRGRTFVVSTFPTDVYDVSALRPTGASVWFPSGGTPSVPACAGVLLNWAVSSPIGPISFDGLLSVGHAIAPADVGGIVAIQSGNVKSSGVIQGRTLSGLDASLFTVNRSSLAGLPAMLLPLRPRQVIDNDFGRTGLSFRPTGPVDIGVTAPPQDQDLGSPWGKQRAIVWVDSGTVGAFAPGSSGSVMAPLDDSGAYQASLIQLGAQPPDYRIGVLRSYTRSR